MEEKGPKTTLVSIGARSRRLKTLPSGTVQPSPLEGEGGASAPGEGEAARPEAAVSIAKRTKKPRAHRHPSARDNARKLRKEMTEAERRLWSLLRSRRLASCKFRRQVPIGPYIADFLSFELQLIIEADGGQHAGSPRDAERDSWLTSQGFRLLRFWNSDIFTNPDGVIARLAEIAPQQEFAR